MWLNIKSSVSYFYKIEFMSRNRRMFKYKIDWVTRYANFYMGYEKNSQSSFGGNRYFQYL